jgi:hypothetical protein
MYTVLHSIFIHFIVFLDLGFHVFFPFLIVYFFPLDSLQAIETVRESESASERKSANANANESVNESESVTEIVTATVVAVTATTVLRALTGKERGDNCV